MNRRLTVGLLIGLLLWIPVMVHAADVPENISLSATRNTITVNWDGDSDADTYNVYWGTSSTNLNQSASVEDPTTEFTISGLSEGTEYYIAVSSVDNSVESNRSPVKSITTDEDEDNPAVPTGFTLTNIIVTAPEMTNDIEFQWDANTESDLDHYNIYYGTTPGTHSNSVDVGDGTAATIEVQAGDTTTRYYFTIAAVDDSDNESDKAEELIVDTLPDSRAPFKPDGISGALAGPNEINITIDPGNKQMTDFAGNNIYYGTASGQYDYSIDIGRAGSHVLTGLPEDANTWYFTASAYDDTGNESAKTPETSVTIEDISLFLNDSGNFDGGCFVASAARSGQSPMIWKTFASLLAAALALSLGYLVRRRPSAGFIVMLIVLGGGLSHAEQWQPAGNNTLGLTGGYYVAAESDYRDVYGKNSYPVSIFYDRFITDHISVEIESGYFQDSGDLLTATGDETDISSKIEMVPTAASIKLHFPIVEYVTGYVGVGPDYWYVKEEPDDASLMSSVEEWVGGFHGKIGFKFYNTDEDFKGSGALIETGYSSVDRIGDNDLNIGGWISEFGIFYQF
ncbi:MAG TPA: fibronectin type III domain-containing protein [Desulfosalsimonadaceae bacterium]|nr:fibronectin type III domain-containing protein [Desulfosalsimonadaceae bacterium]